MAATAPGTAKAGGTTASAPKTLPLGELKIMFFKFLEQQGYALPSEVDSVLGVGSSDSTIKNNVGGRGQSPCPSICSSGKRSSSALSSNEESDNSDSTIKGSDDDDFQIVKRKNKRVARRLRKISSSSQSNDSAMEVEQTKVKSTNHSDSSITSKKVNSVNSTKTVASNKEATTTTYHFTYALEEERKVKAVLKGVPVEIDTEDIKADLVRQEYPVQAVHRMHRRDGTALGLVLAILNKTDGATDIFKKLANVCGLSGITVEAPYKKGIPGQCHRCQLYGHAATNCHAPPRCVKCLDPHWTKECSRTRDSEGKPACCNCESDHTANYGGCPAAPKPKPKSSHNKNITKVHQTSRPLDVSHFPALNSGNKQTARTVPTKPTGSKNFHPAPPEGEPMEESSSMGKSKNHRNRKQGPTKQPTRQTGTAASALGEDIGTIMSILQVVRSAEVADLAAKFRKAKHGVDRLKIILENQELISKLENI
ncbi:Nucleic-acid-binding protein from transposon X-element [Eumeta japonica]|uniref:Nucleic-acid-binding protein from transposon X-element n=1 Tax=Eumeta variegata TaxID=151549 RepID=A0A4C1ZKQ2_EUMVA|nr:Nucleic-acid-binding protein from transposon X-element [Eumeta japonica]